MAFISLFSPITTYSLKMFKLHYTVALHEHALLFFFEVSRIFAFDLFYRSQFIIKICFTLKVLEYEKDG